MVSTFDGVVGYNYLELCASATCFEGLPDLLDEIAGR